MPHSHTPQKKNTSTVSTQMSFPYQKPFLLLSYFANLILCWHLGWMAPAYLEEWVHPWLTLIFFHLHPSWQRTALMTKPVSGTSHPTALQLVTRDLAPITEYLEVLMRKGMWLLLFYYTIQSLSDKMLQSAKLLDLINVRQHTWANNNNNLHPALKFPLIFNGTQQNNIFKCYPYFCTWGGGKLFILSHFMKIITTNTFPFA